ncbi:predicted glycosyltransferase [Hahella chejuensis KCTC 2396]|uniref:Predicted glycosyltransferase n=1 Tax=Hahella chejuensis (strain KCTC 2396) TaxID=349521 RepID=Q2SJW2_HAHCH|nr:glycosyltransferase family 2 protein [Hahella chejuensis]ABC29062.1 predicted glycosyltransferase [Hahella chejuensis KCTC 2396]
MTVTTIIVNYNSGALLDECLKHLEAQTVRSDKIIVVDNASVDGSQDIARAFSNVDVLLLNENLGFAGGNNLALSGVDTEFVALLNPDAFPEPDWLEMLLIAASENPDVGAFGSRQLCSDANLILDGVGDSYHVSGLVWRDRHGAKQQPNDLVTREIFSPCAAAALYRRKALLDIGGFDEDYFCYVEDVDIGFRLRLAGYKSMYVPSAVVYHVGSATTGGQRSDFSVYHGHRNLVWTFIKNMPSYLFWLLLPLHILMNLATVLLFILRGQGRVILRAKWHAIKGAPRAFEKRRDIQSGRVAKVADVWRSLNKRSPSLNKLLPAKLKRSAD